MHADKLHGEQSHDASIAGGGVTIAASATINVIAVVKTTTQRWDRLKG